VAIGGSNVLDAINSPNNPGASCGYTSNAIVLNGLCMLGLPSYVHERNFSSPSISFQPDTCLQSTLSFSIATALPVNQISWNFGDPNSGTNNTATSITATHQFSSVGNYTVTAIAEFECYTDTIEQLLTIVDCPSPPPPVQCGDIFVPTVLSPNGTGVVANKTICVYGGCVSEIVFAIYNRWGEKVFETTDANLTECWDGTYKGKALNAGTFVYKLIVTRTDNTFIEESGNITLVR
jgi:gliding motility-associated-like protein